MTQIIVRPEWTGEPAACLVRDEVDGMDFDVAVERLAQRPAPKPARELTDLTAIVVARMWEELLEEFDGDKSLESLTVADLKDLWDDLWFHNK